jgi:hypothetical protein
MNMNRLRPKPGEDIALFLSGVINDAMRDAIEAGLPTQEAVQIALSMARFHSGSGVQPHPAPCATRTVGGERAVCVYLRDSGKVVVRRDSDVTGAVWLEVVAQAQVHPCYALLQHPDPRPCGLPEGHEGEHQP